MAGSLAPALVAMLIIGMASAQVAAAKGGGQVGEGWGTPGTGNGQLFNPGMFGADTGNGDVYVGDYNGETGKETTEFRIQQLSAAGEFKAATTIKRFPTAKKAIGLQGIAVDAGLGRFYVVESCRVTPGAGNFKCREGGGVFGARNVLAYSTEASGTELVKTATFPLPEGEKELYGPTAIAVDPSNHDILVLAEEGEEHVVVQRIGSAGVLGKRFTDSGDTLKPIGGGEASSLAVAPSGVAYTVVGNSTGAKFTRAFQIPSTMATVEAVPGFATAAEKESWPIGHESFVESAFGGPQLAISTDGGTLYWKEQRAKSGGPTEPGDLLVRGYSLAKSETVAIWGGGTSKCKITTSASPLAVTAAGNVVVLDSGAETTKPGNKPGYGLKEMTFGVGGSGCVEPVAKFTINGKKEGEEPTGIKPGETVSFDASSSELAGGFRKEVVWKFGDGSEKVVTEPKEGEEAPATVTHVYSSAAKVTVKLEIRLKSPFYGNPASERGFSVGSPAESFKLTVTRTGSGTIAGNPAGIECGPATSDCEEEYEKGKPVTLTESPEPGSVFKGWSGCDSEEESGKKCKVTMSAAKSVAAEFALEQHTLTVNKTGSGTVASNPAGINCGGTCSAPFNHNVEVTLTASPEAGSEFKGWSGACSGTGACKVTMSAAKSVGAEFAQTPKFKLSVTRSGTGANAGKVTGSPAGIDCGSDCEESYEQGTEVTLTASPEAGSEFKGWSGACSGTGACKVTMSAAKSVAASFGLEKRQLSVTVAGTGTGSVTSSPAGISCSGGTCSHEYDYGTSVTLSGSSGANTGPVAWGGCDEIVGANECKVTLTVAGNVTASFPAIGFSTLIVTRTGLGTIASNPAGIECGPATSDCEEEYEKGKPVTLTESPEPGSVFKGWSGCDSEEESGKKCKVTMSAAKSVAAEFALEQHTLTVNKTGSGTVASNPAGINCGSVCSAPFNHNVEVTLTASPEAGSEFKGWSGACSGTGACKVTMSAAKSVAASFGLEKRQLSVTVAGTGTGSVTSSPAGISCSGGTCSHEYDYGTSVTLSASPSGGAEFAGWSGACAGTAACTVTLSEATSVTAIFSTELHTLTVAPTGSGSGTITSSPAGIDCGSTCAAPFDHGTEVTLTASPEAGSEFKGWSGACSGTGACKVTMSAAKSVAAEFALEQHTLTVNKTGSGSGTITSSPAGIDCGTTCSAKYVHGSSVTLSAVLGPDTEAVTWSGCASEPSPTECTVTMGGAESVGAVFALEQHPLAVTKPGSGAGTVTSSPAGIDCGVVCAAEFDQDSQVTLTAVADEGSEFKGWSGAGCTGTGACKVTMSEAKAVGAEFARQPGHSLLTLRKHGSGSATVTSAPAGIDCGGSCETTSFGEGTTVTLAVAGFGPHTLETVAWTGCASEPSPTECTVTLGAAPTTVTATFALERHRLSVTKNGAGAGTVVSAPAEIFCGSVCAADFDQGNEVTLIAAPADGSEFAGWSGACSGRRGCRVTVDAAKTVTAGFALVPSESSESTPSGGGEEAVPGGSTKAEKLERALKKCKGRKGRARIRCEQNARAAASGKAKPKRHPRRHPGRDRRRAKGER